MGTALPPINKRDNSCIHKKKQKETAPKKMISQHAFPRSRADKLAYDRSYELRHNLPVLKKEKIAKFRNSHKHNLCLELLTKGFHMSFCEVTNLTRRQMARREAAGPESFLWTKPVLEKQPEKLDMMKIFMTKSEAAKRNGDIYREYRARYDLAQYFTDNPDDQWLADHFFNTCLEVAKREDKAETQMLAEGLCNVGLCLQKNQRCHSHRLPECDTVFLKFCKDTFRLSVMSRVHLRRENHKEAAKHFESYHRLAKNYKEQWSMKNGVSFFTDSCIKLYNIYTILGLELGKSSEEEDIEASLQYLKQAVEMAKDSQDKKLEGEASYTLGLAYQKVNQLDAAQSHLFNFYESCQGDSNSEGIGRACDAIAKIYARQGNKEKSVEFLKRFVELTEKTGLEREYCLACCNLGNVCNSVGNYDEATEYFSKAYNISRTLQGTESANINRVQYGIAVAHRMMGKFANHIVIADRTCLTRLLVWKCVRKEAFDELIPDTAPMAAVHVLIPPIPEQPEEMEEGCQEGDEEEEEEEDFLVKADIEIKVTSE